MRSRCYEAACEQAQVTCLRYALDPDSILVKTPSSYVILFFVATGLGLAAAFTRRRFAVAPLAPVA